MILCQLLLQAQQAFFIPGLHQFMNQGSGREEADGEPLLAGRQTETEGDMGLAGSAVAERDDILTTLDVFASRQLQNQHLVERCDGLEVEAVEAFDGGEPGLSDPPLDHAALTVDQFWTHPGKVEAPYTVCIASASNLTGLVKSSVECRRTGL